MNASIACHAAGGSVVVAGSVRPAWTEGGLTQARAGSVVAGSSRPAWTGGGLRLTRPGSASPVSSVAGLWSPVDLAEHGVHRAHARPPASSVAPGREVWTGGRLGEGASPPLHAVWLRPAVAHDVTADLATRPLHTRVALTLGHPDLPDRLHPRPRRDRSFGEPVEALTDDPDRLSELAHPHAVARVAVAGGLHRDDEVEILIGRVRLGPPDVVAHPRAPDERPRHSHLLGEFARDHADPLRTHAEEGVVFQHRLVLVDPRLDEVDGLAHFLIPARRGVVTRASDLMETVEQPRAGQLLEAIEDHLTFADAVEEHRRPAAERSAHVQAPRAEPEAVRRDPLQLGGDHSQILRAPGDLELPDLLHGGHIRELRGHGCDIIGLRRDRRVLDVREGLAELLVAAMEVADHRVHADDRLPLERENHPEDAVGRRVLRPHVHHEALVTAVADLDDLFRLRFGHPLTSWARTAPERGRASASRQAAAWPCRGRPATPGPASSCRAPPPAR